MNVPPRENCPDEEVLQELAAGIGSPELAQQTMQHVARCSTCSAALRRYVKEFSDEQSPENVAILNQLQSSKPGWQKRLVGNLKGRGRWFPWLNLVPAAAVLAMAIFAIVRGPAVLANFKVAQAKKQVAAAFADRRTTLMRLPSVDHSQYKPFPLELGPEDGRGLDEVPTSLHDASGAANQNLLSGKPDPRWLQVQGLALLWESTPISLEKAEKDFEKARSAGLATPSLEIDLAASYFERDSRAEHPNLQRTLNLLSEVLTKPNLSKDDQASALFNLAIAYEKTQAWDLAVSTWEKYLQVDSSSDWASEAQQHLKDAKAKISTRPQQSYSDPSFFLQQKAQGNLRLEDPEQYQQKAFSQWLPTAVADKGGDAYRAVNGLAEIFAEHQDFWWKDFLNEIKPSDSGAVRELSDAVLNNEQGKYDAALTQAQAAIKDFIRNKNTSGELLAQFQEIYALRSKLEGKTCLARAGPLIQQLSKTRFAWLRAQSLLESAQCNNFLTELDKSDADSSESLQLAKRFRFPVLSLRVLGISAGMKRQQGKNEEVWKLGVEGLGVYWQGFYPAERLDQFYAVMLQGAEDSKFPYLAEALLRHILMVREQPGSRMPKNPIREGMRHLELANLLKARHDDEDAEIEKQAASAMLEDIAHIYPEDYKALRDMRPAENDLQHEEAERALATLKGMRGLIEHTQYKELALNYYRLLGEVHLHLKHFDEAAASFGSAIEIADSALESLKSTSDRLSWKRATEESYRGEVRVLLAQKKDRQALERWEQYKSWPSLRAQSSGEVHAAGTAKGAASNKKALVLLPSSSEVRLIYAIFPDGVQIWSLKNNRIQSFWKDIAKQELENEVRLFAEQCSTPNSRLSDVDKQGLKLYSVLVQPVAAELSESPTVIIELDQPVYELSMEGLKTPSGPYFGEKYSVIYSPGIWMEQSLRSPAPLRPVDSLFLLDATHSAGATYLPGMEAERSNIVKAFSRSTVVDTSTENWLNMRHQFAASQIFHYMGHGKPSKTGTDLVLNPKQSLGADDFTADLLSHSEMVVLAACSSGRGSKEGLLDNQNLVHSFLMAGVPRVVASNWNVDSESTSELMISFYQHVAADQTVAQAMATARREVLAKNPHPYYWAGFSVTGRVN